MLVVPGVDDPFVPWPTDQIMMPVAECREVRPQALLSSVC